MFQGTIRTATTKDLEAAHKIYSQYFTDREDLEHITNRVKEFTNGAKEALQRHAHYLVAEKDGDVVGVIGFRKPHPKSKLSPFYTTERPVELYTLFVKDKQHGAGQALVERMLEIAKKDYMEVIVYSNEKWKESWPFYDRIGFERAGMIQDKYSGQVWRKIL